MGEMAVCNIKNIIYSRRNPMRTNFLTRGRKETERPAALNLVESLNAMSYFQLSASIESRSDYSLICANLAHYLHLAISPLSLI